MRRGSSSISASRLLARTLRRLAPRSRRCRVPEVYEPAVYWERRAPELLEVYAHPESWEARRWMRAGVEEAIVPDVLTGSEIASVLVVGVGAGRQYEYLRALPIELRGFDISPTLVARCREHFPEIPTRVSSLLDARETEEPADAVLSAAVLQHVSPDEIIEAVAIVQGLARKLVVLRELIRVSTSSHYQWAHDYRSLFAGWDLLHDQVTDDGDAYTVDLMVWRRSRVA